MNADRFDRIWPVGRDAPITAPPQVAAEPRLWRMVGRTPLYSLEGLHPGGVAVHLKCEWMNPGGSVKDRAALWLLRAGREAGALPGKQLLDASSGNTAIAYAMLGAAAGIGVTVCVPVNASRERMVLLRAHGAVVVETDPLEGSDGAIREAQARAAAHPDRYWYADQYGNPATWRVHYETTAREIWRQTQGRVTHLVAGLGTTGTLMGTGRRLRELNPDIVLVAVEPSEPFHGLEGLKHLETSIVPPIYDPTVPTAHERVDTEAAERMVFRVAREFGLLLGWSGGAALVGACRVAARAGDDTCIVVVGADSGHRYLSETRRWERAG